MYLKACGNYRTFYFAQIKNISKTASTEVLSNWYSMVQAFVESLIKVFKKINWGSREGCLYTHIYFDKKG